MSVLSSGWGGVLGCCILYFCSVVRGCPQVGGMLVSAGGWVHEAVESFLDVPGHGQCQWPSVYFHVRVMPQNLVAWVHGDGVVLL